jgi:hypothetical protein
MILERAAGRAFVVLAALSSMAACGAHAVEPIRVKYATLEQDPNAVHFDRPTVIEFSEGDVIPVELHFDGELFDLRPASPKMELLAKHHCFVRIEAGGMHASLDGNDFEARPKVPGRFRIGFETGKAGPMLLVEIATPRHAKSDENR